MTDSSTQILHRPEILLPSEIINRVFHIHYGEGSGTGFAINIDGREYLITARHVVQNMVVGYNDILYYAKNGEWISQQVKLLHVSESIHPGGDWAIIDGFNLSKNIPHLDFTTAGWHAGQEVYFYGFPHDLRIEMPGDMNNGFPIPLIKTGTISGFSHDTKEPVELYIDAFGNPGFSGGPLVCRDRKDNGKLKVTGIVKSVYPESLGNNPYQTNSGIMFASSIKFSLMAIKPNIKFKT